GWDRMHLHVRLLVFGSRFLLSACSEAPAPQRPTVPDTDPAFADSSSCRNCHEAQFSDGRGSRHDLAMQVADESTLLGDYDIAWALATMYRDSGNVGMARHVVELMARDHPDDANVTALPDSLIVD
ncbi:MAG: hypothetical protein OEM76_17660, partial [Gammaproteobacteria bacterium]|nr:hypothetical protein [Gammaproteobacteria bacterium]